LLNPIFGIQIGRRDTLQLPVADPHKRQPHPGYLRLGERFQRLTWTQREPELGFSQSQLVKLVVLEFIMQEVRNVMNMCRGSPSIGEQESWYRESGDIQSTLKRVRNCAEVSRYAKELDEVVELVTKNLELEEGISADTARRLLQMRSTSAQLISLAEHNMNQYRQAWDTYRDLLNIREAEGVKRLTVLAAIFLPLSLSASILSMSNRLVDEPLRLFDFVGVFFIVSWLALLVYALIVTFNKLVRYMNADDENANWESGRWTRIAPVLAESPRKLLVIEKTETVLKYTAMPLLWTLLAVSFTISMVKDHGNDVQLGMKVLAYGIIGLLGLIFVPVCLLTIDAFITDSQVNKLRKMLEGRLKIG
jgi:CorA-like Mg2+ transporter protein